MNLRAFSFVYGKHVKLLKRTVTSLGWPKNKKALGNAVWSVYTTKEDEQAVREIIPGRVEVTSIKASRDIGRQLAECLINELKLCYQSRAAMIMAPPDTIFGDGTIQTLVTLGAEGDNAISVSHPRVVLETFPDLKEPVSNAQLVSLAFEHMHEVWSLSNINLPKNNAHSSGTAWREIEPGLYAVTMRIPTPYFFRPTARDIGTLEAAGSGGWDHKWPQSLMKEQRHRIIGSSDAAFMVELSPLNIPQGKVGNLNRDEPDEYGGKLLHHQVNRNTLAIWRADVATPK